MIEHTTTQTLTGGSVETGPDSRSSHRERGKHEAYRLRSQLTLQSAVAYHVVGMCAAGTGGAGWKADGISLLR